MLPVEHQEEIVRTEYEAYARTGLVQLRRVKDGTMLEEDHMRNRQLVVHWLMAHTSAIDRRTRDGNAFYVVVDVKEFRAGVGRLLAEIQRVKSEGDYPAALALVQTYGTHFDPDLRDQVLARVRALNVPSYTAFVQPRLQPVTDAAGSVTDVLISYPCNFEQQMLEYAGKRPGSAGPAPA